MPTIVENVKAVQASLKEKLAQTGRETDEVLVVAVTKTHPVETIESALKAGIRHFGENKVQEARRKLPFITEPYEGFHYIGRLQTNKINALLELEPILIHSIDSLNLAVNLNKRCETRGRVQDILVQVNTTGEQSKSGCEPGETIELVQQISDLPNLRVKGLMTIGLMSDDAEKTRPSFKLLKELFDELKNKENAGYEMRWLSMGMSGDYLTAIEEGANIIRLGSVLFGERDYGGDR
ncbi:MAG TPA: YggS family pyridoxal phosphate-dependent enzyme [Candidatus Cloacimonetes bacterium]|jgi:pyridoxal phosphate enzyme (YggS family)|nr:YggS family pyridoxal phosphate-dependent enzyme [Candidatus Cloacimonadota bacterium]